MAEESKDRRLRRMDLVPERELYTGWRPWGISRFFPEWVQRELDEMYGLPRSRGSYLWPEAEVDRVRVPAIDIKDEGERYEVEAEIPGISKDEVSIQIGDGVLEISARRESEEEEKGEGYVRRERGYLSYSRSLALPEDASEEGVEATLEDGVLKVTIPKMEGMKKKQVEIK